MKEKPILFAGEMVRAILEGRKTQTRRVMKIQPKYSDCALSRLADTTDRERRKHIDKLHWVRLSDDRLNVVYDDNRYFRCPYGLSGDRLWVRETFTVMGGLSFYRADGEMSSDDKKPWTPSIHMPRWASRIDLLIKNIRVERLQDISEKDAKAEGVDSVSEFIELWESINRGDSWGLNPWVWVVEFEKVKGEG